MTHAPVFRPPVFGPYVGIPLARTHPEWARVRDARLAADPAPGVSAAAVNAWVNRRIVYRADLDDHWQTPEATLALGHGDCEDLAILKRALLIAKGLDAAGTAIVVGLDRVARAAHAVLLAEGLVLDSFHDAPIEPADLLAEFHPNFAYGAQTWLFGLATPQPQGDPT
jgi:predicted transglutaminase-like cysteine proteinase